MRVGGTGRWAQAAVGAIAVVAVTAGCGTGGGDRQAASAPTLPAPKVNGYITVVADDAMAAVLEREARAFEEAHRLASVTVQSGASRAIAGELLQGRVTDLYVSADPQDMDRVAGADLVYGIPLRFARSRGASTMPVIYSVGMMNTTGDQVTSRAFMGFLLTPKGRKIIEAGGFRAAS